LQHIGGHQQQGMCNPTRQSITETAWSPAEGIKIRHFFCSNFKFSSAISLGIYTRKQRHIIVCKGLEDADTEFSNLKNLQHFQGPTILVANVHTASLIVKSMG
jgi:hypothetical protein